MDVEGSPDHEIGTAYSWRCGESNPGPLNHRRRHLRAQPSASIRNSGTLMASFPLPYPDLIFPPRSRNPSGGILHCDAWIRRGRNPPGRRAAFSYAARAKLSSAPIGVCRLFNEDSGDLGSLPAPQHSTSKPFHPHGLCSMQRYRERCIPHKEVLGTR